jgi:hypothetical protein
VSTRPLGSLVGAVGGLVFVLVNAGAVPASTLWRAAAVLAAVAVVWFVVVRGPAVERVEPSRTALRTYGFCVVAMLVALPVGARVLTDVLDEPDAVLPWVVLVVGLHFLPFASAFGLPVLRWLAAALVAVATAGAAGVLTTDGATAAGWTGVAAGVVLLAFAALGPRRSRA